MKKGFTLIELLAVIVIVAIIALIGVYSVTKIMQKSRMNSLKSTALAVRKAARTQLTEDNPMTASFSYDMTPNGGAEEYLMDLNKDPWGRNFVGVIADVNKTVEGDYEITVYLTLANGEVWMLADGSDTLTKNAALVDILVIGGGGGGAAAGSGGGAGGYIYQPNLQLSGTNYPVVIGNGGAGGNPSGVFNANSGENSSFAGQIALGGGGGVTHGQLVGQNGGSGGGGSIMPGGTDVPAPGTGTQGNNGGNGHIYVGWYGNTGGGGGAGTAGQAGCYNDPGCGNGGDGLANDISGASVIYAGGGGGGELNDWSDAAVGGNGGGGNTTNDGPGINGVNGLGGGGGGGSYNWNGTYYAGGNGGSGVVIIRYVTGTMDATGGTVTTSGIYTIHTFLSNGNFTIN